MKKFLSIMVLSFFAITVFNSDFAEAKSKKHKNAQTLMKSKKNKRSIASVKTAKKMHKHKKTKHKIART